MIIIEIQLDTSEWLPDTATEIETYFIIRIFCQIRNVIKLGLNDLLSVFDVYVWLYEAFVSGAIWRKREKRLRKDLR